MERGGPTLHESAPIILPQRLAALHAQASELELGLGRGAII